MDKEHHFGVIGVLFYRVANVVTRFFQVYLFREIEFFINQTPSSTSLAVPFSQQEYSEIDNHYTKEYLSESQRL